MLMREGCSNFNFVDETSFFLEGMSYQGKTNGEEKPGERTGTVCTLLTFLVFLLKCCYLSASNVK